jgi:hypothetical protein
MEWRSLEHWPVPKARRGKMQPGRHVDDDDPGDTSKHPVWNCV